MECVQLFLRDRHGGMGRFIFEATNESRVADGGRDQARAFVSEIGAPCSSSRTNSNTCASSLITDRVVNGRPVRAAVGA